jgi:hypothetical protein
MSSRYRVYVGSLGLWFIEDTFVADVVAGPFIRKDWALTQAQRLARRSASHA